MGQVKGSGNLSTERRLIAVLREKRITGWRRAARLPGHPDFTFPKAKLAVFVHGCFWHGHSCPRGKNRPVTNRSYWIGKLQSNLARDRRVRRKLNQLSWRTLVVWECDLVRRSSVIAKRIAARLRAGRQDRQ